MRQYLDLLKDIKENGHKKANRTGVETPRKLQPLPGNFCADSGLNKL